jgi:hypothetical protein
MRICGVSWITPADSNTPESAPPHRDLRCAAAPSVAARSAAAPERTRTHRAPAPIPPPLASGSGIGERFARIWRQCSICWRRGSMRVSGRRFHGGSCRGGGDPLTPPGARRQLMHALPEAHRLPLAAPLGHIRRTWKRRIAAEAIFSRALRWRRRESKTSRGRRRARFRGEEARFGTRGDRVPCRVVHLSVRVLVVLGRNRPRLPSPNSSYGMSLSPRWPVRSCSPRRLSAGSSWR